MRYSVCTGTAACDKSRCLLLTYVQGSRAEPGLGDPRLTPDVPDVQKGVFLCEYSGTVV